MKIRAACSEGQPAIVDEAGASILEGEDYDGRCCGSLGAECSNCDEFGNEAGGLRCIVRHDLRVVRFLPLWKSCDIFLGSVFSARQSDRCLSGCARHVRRRLRHSSSGRAGVRTYRRQDRAQGRLYRDDRNHGHFDSGSRRVADLRIGGLRRTFHASVLASFAGLRAGRRIRGRRDLRCGARCAW